MWIQLAQKFGGFSRDPGPLNQAVYSCGWEWSLEEELITSMPPFREHTFIAHAGFLAFLTQMIQSNRLYNYCQTNPHRTLPGACLLKVWPRITLLCSETECHATRQRIKVFVDTKL